MIFGHFVFHMFFLNLSFATASCLLCFVFGATFLPLASFLQKQLLTTTKKSDVSWFCKQKKWISVQNSAPGLLCDRSWASLLPRCASFWPTLAVPSALSRRPSVEIQPLNRKVPHLASVAVARIQNMLLISYYW